MRFIAWYNRKTCQSELFILLSDIKGKLANLNYTFVVDILKNLQVWFINFINWYNMRTCQSELYNLVVDVIGKLANLKYAVYCLK